MRMQCLCLLAALTPGAPSYTATRPSAAVIGGRTGSRATAAPAMLLSAAPLPLGNPAAAPQRARVAASRSSPVVMQEVDFYAELGVGKGASEGEIKKAYRNAARKWHPDVNQEPGAKEKFQSINEAYQVLSDPTMRQRYDQFGVAGVRGPGAGGPGPGMQDFDLGDIFESFFGGQGGPGGPGGQRRRSGPTQGDDLRFDLEIDFQTALFGGSKKIRITHLENCDTCSGSGVAPGASVNTCQTCGGRGVVMQQMNTILGRIQQQARCPTCGGSGQVVEKYCGTCDGKGTNKKSKQLTITIPPGVEDGNRLRVRGEGDAGPRGGPSGDLYVFLSVTSDPRFRREGMDIYSDVSVSYLDAILGAAISVPTVDGDVELTVPAGTQPMTTMRIAGKGAPKLNAIDQRGTHFVKVNVEIPRSLSGPEKDLVLQLKEKSK